MICEGRVVQVLQAEEVRNRIVVKGKKEHDDRF
jgi:hypothetical protein